MKRWSILAAMLMVALLAITPGHGQAQTVTYPAGADPDMLDPSNAQSNPAEAVQRMIFENLKGVAIPAVDEEIDALLLHRLKCNTYAMFKKLLDGLEAQGHLAGDRRDRFLSEIAQMTCEAGGTCAFIGTGNTDRVVLHALGLVPRGADLLTEAAGDETVAHATRALLDAVRNDRQERSASRLVKANLRNALRVYCAVGESVASEVPPPSSPRKYWTRRGIAHWLAERLAEDVPTIVS